MPSPHTLKEVFENAFREYHSAFHRNLDPLKVVHQYSKAEDQEIAAFFCALLAYGNVRTILNSCERALAPLADSPARFLKERDRFDGLWNNFTHRFTRGEDLEIVAAWLSSILREHGSIEAFFRATTRPIDSEMKTLLSDFVQRLRHLPLSERLQNVRRKRERNLKYLISDPEQGSACKRLNMFLRWMIRHSDGVDLGLWKTLSPKQLILPIDTHLLQTLQKLRWTRSKQATWRVAENATKRLAQINPDDPVRYDFALCHLSMSGGKLRA